jgi:hypothetical protein
MIIFGKDYGDPVMRQLGEFMRDESGWEEYCGSLHQDEEPTYEGYEEWKHDRIEVMADMEREARREGWQP